MDQLNPKEAPVNHYAVRFVNRLTQGVFALRLTALLPRLHMSARITFLLAGVAATVWFLVRVIPKPQRATYPCMQAAAPLMSTFVLYLVGLVTSLVAFRKARVLFVQSKTVRALPLLGVALFCALLTLPHDERPVFADTRSLIGPNQPIGVARGIYPGRVVWVWDSSATNENCSNVFGNGWFLPANTNQVVVSAMAADMVRNLTGKTTVPDSWDALFRYFNSTHGRVAAGYASGEKIFIKVNQVSASASTITDDYTIKNTSRYGMAEASPQLVLALLRQLVNECGVRQEDISVGDPLKHLYKHVYELWHGEFPGITYIDYRGTYGRTKPVPDSVVSIYYSDRGTVLKDGTTPVTGDVYPTVLMRATYLINIAALKAHARAGVTLCAKNHFGSHGRSSASHLHQGLVSPDMVPSRTGYGLYRVQVDLMGHKHLGEKTVLFVVDGLWGGSEANDPPRKFSMTPFNGDWSSSLFASQDDVALESVCFDFLKTEFTQSNPYGSHPQINGVDDYLLQAADSTFWPANIVYDPEKDGTRIGSLGVFEHWNNATDKQYTRNLQPGNGIELVTIAKTTTAVAVEQRGPAASFVLSRSYPNPFNGQTTIQYELAATARVSVVIYNALGQPAATLVDASQAAGPHRVRWDARDDGGSPLPSGVYLCRVAAGSLHGVNKLVYVK